MKRRELIKAGLAAGAAATFSLGKADASRTRSDTSAVDDRSYWIVQMDRVCRPVFEALSQRRLKAVMPVEAHAGMHESRRHTTYLEALGRALAGIAPWLEHGGTSGAEGKLRAQYCEMTRAAIAAAVDKGSPDYMEFGKDHQTLVDTAFLALAVIRAPQELHAKLPAKVRAELVDALRATRVLLPGFNNWLLFSAMVEACLLVLGESWDRMRVDYALRELESWFVGDGTYGDGPHFHWDYYNSFVIQPFLLTLMDVLPGWRNMAAPIRARAQRYATIQERLIAPDGSYPVVGRSITYRCGAFQLLAEESLRESLASTLEPEQVRCALTAVIRRTLGPAGTFDENGWLQIGLAGHQPSLGEEYISTGSLYLCTGVFLPLGLAADNKFWSGKAAPWTSQQLWQGVDLPADHALSE